MVSQGLFKIAAVALLASFALAPAWSQQQVNYGNRNFDCEWMEQEYDRVLAINETPVQDNLGGVILAEILTAPFFLVEDLMGLTFPEPKAPSMGGKVTLSGDIDDIETASFNKNCYLLSDRILKDREAGKLNNLVATPTSSVLAVEK